MGWRIHRGDPPAASKWTDRGRVEQEAQGEPRTAFETPGRLLKEAEADGKRHGATRTPENIAVGPDSGAIQSILGKIKARKGAITLRHRRQEIERAKQVAMKKPRLAANKEDEAATIRHAERLEKELPGAEARVKEQAVVVDGWQGRYEELSRSAKGFIGDLAVLVGIEASVVVFDGGSLYSALEKAGFSEVAVWFLAGAVPLLIGATNHALGLLAGAIETKLGPNRLRVAAGVFAAGFGMLVTAFGLLMIFRAAATSDQNHTLAQWAGGNFHSHPSFILSPLWLGPAQIAGSISSIASVALYTVAKPGRELRGRLREATGELVSREAAVKTIKQGVEAAYKERDAHRKAAHEIITEIAGVEAELDRYGELLEAELDGESGLGEAAEGRLRTSFDYERQLFENGDVVRAAVPSIFRFFGRWFTPASSVRKAAPPAPPFNGHGSMTPEELGRHL